jgi:hypothetical protein
MAPIACAVGFSLCNNLKTRQGPVAQYNEDLIIVLVIVFFFQRNRRDIEDERENEDEPG